MAAKKAAAKPAAAKTEKLAKEYMEVADGDGVKRIEPGQPIPAAE